jgi:hypothetical protein
MVAQDHAWAPVGLAHSREEFVSGLASSRFDRELLAPSEFPHIAAFGLEDEAVFVDKFANHQCVIIAFRPQGVIEVTHNQFPESRLHQGVQQNHRVKSA